jgi:hypothetical protein
MGEDKEHEGTFAEGQSEEHHGGTPGGDFSKGQEDVEQHEGEEHEGSFAEGQSEDHHGGHRGGDFAEGQEDEEHDH